MRRSRTRPAVGQASACAELQLRPAIVAPERATQWLRASARTSTAVVSREGATAGCPVPTVAAPPAHPRRPTRQSGAVTVEFALTYVGLIIPVTFAIIFTAQLLWVWHSAIEWTREGARYAATHCWQADGTNVSTYMRQNVPVNVDQDQFSAGTAEISVSYYSRDPLSGVLVDFTCDGDCSTACIPDAAIVSVTGYQFTRFFNYLGLNPIVMPNFSTTVAVEGAGCNPEDGSCSP